MMKARVFSICFMLFKSSPSIIQIEETALIQSIQHLMGGIVGDWEDRESNNYCVVSCNNIGNLRLGVNIMSNC